MDRRNVVNKCQKELASIIGMSPQAFSSALKQLEGNELIFRIGGRDKSRRIMLSAYFVGIGTEDEINKAGGEFHNRFSKGHDPKPSKRERARKDSDKNKGTE
jgi:DNA-binding transcriptional ArsR family regulator